MKDSVKDLFSSKWGFVFAAAGSAIGMGNIWLFPYRVGELGGAAFLIPYIICVALLGFSAIIGEITLGRLTGTGPAGAFKKILTMRGKNGAVGEIFGWICVAVVAVIGFGYSVVVSWVMRFLAGSVSGAAYAAQDNLAYFSSAVNSHVIFWVFITLAVISVCMIGGVEKGIERICKFMIPSFLILFLFLTVRVAFLPNAVEGYKYLLTPRWEFLLNARTWILALGQAFYSLSIFGSIMIVYGSYARKNEDVISSGRNIVILDTISSLIACFLIIPAVFAFGKNISSGPSLLFITMPEIFKTIPFGQALMIIFFLAVFFAAVTSLISILEVLVEALQNKFKMPRYLAVAASVGAAFACNFLINGKIGALMDILEIHFVPLCALTAGIFTFWIAPSKKVLSEISVGRDFPVGKWFVYAGRYVLCSLIIILYILNILGV